MQLRRWATEIMLIGASFSCGLYAHSQYNGPATPAPYNPIALSEITGAPRTAVEARQKSFQSQSPNPYLGGVPEGKASTTALQLSLEDAVNRGLKQNLAGELASDAVRDAEGQRWQALGELLPDVVTDTLNRIVKVFGRQFPIGDVSRYLEPLIERESNGPGQNQLLLGQFIPSTNQSLFTRFQLHLRAQHVYGGSNSSCFLIACLLKESFGRVSLRGGRFKFRLVRYGEQII